AVERAERIAGPFEQAADVRQAVGLAVLVGLVEQGGQIALLLGSRGRATLIAQVHRAAQRCAGGRRRRRRGGGRDDGAAQLLQRADARGELLVAARGVPHLIEADGVVGGFGGPLAARF